MELPPVVLRELAAEEGEPPLVLAIVTLPREPGEPATINLQGPLALNLGQRLGRQVVLDSERFGVREAVELGVG